MDYKKHFTNVRVAIVHDWLVSLGGAERVVESLLKLFPQADIYTSVYEPDKVSLFKAKNIHTSFLQHWPLAKRKHQLFASLRPMAFESFDFQDYDLVISSSSAESKGVITPTETLHISYIHTPIRYYWSGYEEYYQNPGFGLLNPLVRMVMPAMVKKLKTWDYAAAQRPDYLIANSEVVQRRIAKYYDRNSVIINPPVNLDRFKGIVQRGKSDYYLVVSRLVPYKRVDLAVQVCSKLQKRLIVVGKGPELGKLRKMASREIEFITDASDQQVAKLYSRAKALIFSADEDFGITPVESMASGTPVICFAKGGATETVIDGKTGIYHDKQTVGSLEKAILEFEHAGLSMSDMKKRAGEFSEDVFLDKIGGFVLERLQEKKFD